MGNKSLRGRGRQISRLRKRRIALNNLFRLRALQTNKQELRSENPVQVPCTSDVKSTATQTFLDQSTSTELTPVRRRLVAEGLVSALDGEGSAQTSSIEPQPGTSSNEAVASLPHNNQKEPTNDEYTEPEVKVEPPEESAFTIVIRDPLADTTMEGSFRELFHSRENPVVDPGVDPGVDSEGDPGDGALVIDEPEPPAKKSRETKKPKKPKKPKLDINYYKKELEQYKKEVVEQIAEIQKQHKEIKSKNETIKRLNRSVQNLRDKNTALKKENSDLRQELEKATRKITELKRQKKAAESINSLEDPNEIEPTTKIEQENFKTIVDNQLSELATQIDEQNQAIQMINSINDNLIELAAQINKEAAMASKEFANQLLSSVNTQLTKLETRIRKQEMALATQRERKEVAMATQSILLDSLNEQGQVPESFVMDTAGLTDSMD